MRDNKNLNLTDEVVNVSLPLVLFNFIYFIRFAKILS